MYCILHHFNIHTHHSYPIYLGAISCYSCFFLTMPILTVSVLGAVAQDLITVVNRLPDDGETVVAKEFKMQGGGKGSNSAVATYRLSRPNPKNSPNAHNKIDDNDLRVRMIGAVGEDEFGPPLKENLAKHGLNVDGVRVLKGQSTAVANILVEAGNGANRIMQYPGAADALEPADFMTLESLGGGVAPDLVISQLEIRRETIVQAIETANREGVDVLLNPAPAGYLIPDIYPKITHLVMNETEAVLLSGCEPEDMQNQTGWAKVTEHFLNLGVKNVVVTLGQKGAFYSNVSGSGYVEAEKNCTVIDTSGAGCVPRLLLRLHCRIHIISLENSNTGIIGIVLWVRTQRNTWHRSKRVSGISGLRYSTDAKRQHV